LNKLRQKGCGYLAGKNKKAARSNFCGLKVNEINNWLEIEFSMLRKGWPIKLALNLPQSIDHKQTANS